MNREALINLGIRVLGIVAFLTCVDAITGSNVLEYVTRSDEFSTSTRVTIGLVTFITAVAAAQTLDRRLGHSD